MKKFLSLFAIAIAIMACSEDDVTEVPDDTSNPPVDNGPVGEASVVINEVAYLSAEVELYNNGDIAIDVSDYFLCLGPGTYDRVSTLITSGNATMEPGDFLVLNYARPGATGGLGLYINNSGFGDAANIADFVQWGNAGSARENVAVAAGIWTAGDFIPVLEDSANSIVYDGEGEASSDWTETSTVTLGSSNVVTEPVTPEASVVLNEVGYLGNFLELYNNGNVAVDVSDYFLCLGPGTYRRVGDLNVEGDLNLQPGAFLSIAYEMPSATGGIGLYANNDGFADAANILDFVQWGAAGSPRENVAVEAGLWTAGEYVDVVGSADNSIAYDGEGSSAADWSETTTTTFGAANSFTAPEIRSVIINEVEYLVEDLIELYNNGNTTIDLSDYWMCFGPGQYFRIGDPAMTTIVSGDVNLAPGDFLVITPAALEAPNDAGGLGLYANNNGFGNADNIRSFVQWGNSGNAREGVAVEAGIWNAGGFVPNVASGSSIAYDGEGFTADDWAEDTTPTLGSGNGSSSSSNSQGGQNNGNGNGSNDGSNDGYDGYNDGTDTGN
ncbi:hypothetical protein ABV409_00355 [Flagellimonas sp. DF-77]|uniref:hypothetical protein n=1 Tax=Flagellimonas algarum TaxID=3230298 RepID=UPI003390CFE9